MDRQPSRELGDRGRVGWATDQVLAGTLLDDRATQRRTQRHDIESRRCGESEVLFGTLTPQVGRSGIGDETTPIDDHHPIGEPLGLLEIVRGEDDGNVLVPQPENHVPDTTPAFGIDPGGRFIEEHDIGTTDEGQCE